MILLSVEISEKAENLYKRRRLIIFCPSEKFINSTYVPNATVICTALCWRTYDFLPALHSRNIRHVSRDRNILSISLFHIVMSKIGGINALVNSELKNIIT